MLCVTVFHNSRSNSEHQKGRIGQNRTVLDRMHPDWTDAFSEKHENTKQNEVFRTFSVQ